MMRITIPNLKLLLKIIIYIKTLDLFQDNVRYSIFEHILNLKHCRVFEAKPTFEFLCIIRNSEPNSLS